MNVRELKKLLSGIADETEVLIPVSTEFDGRFYSPCVDESGLSQIAAEEHEEPEDEEFAEQKDVFMLVPHGFSDEPEGPPAELN